MRCAVAEFTPEELELLRTKVTVGAGEVKTKIPDAPDISDPPEKAKEGIIESAVGLIELGPDEIPTPGRHFVVWGSDYLDDIRRRPVKRSAPVTENEHAKREIAHTKRLLEYGLKNPKYKGLDRVGRTEQYARWRYRGYVCGEVASL